MVDSDQALVVQSCPVVKMGEIMILIAKNDFLTFYLGKLCIEVKSSDKIAFISEFLCIGCGICVKK